MEPYSLNVSIIVMKTPGDVDDGCSSYYSLGDGRFIRLDEGNNFISDLVVMDAEYVKKDITDLIENEQWELVECYAEFEDLIPPDAFKLWKETGGQDGQL